VTAAQEMYEQQQQADGPVTDHGRTALLHVVTDFLRLAPSPNTRSRTEVHGVAPRRRHNARQTSPHVVALINQRLNDHTDRHIAMQLNAEGYVSGAGGSFTASWSNGSGVNTCSSPATIDSEHAAC
jgi:hypothetical protein